MKTNRIVFCLLLLVFSGCVRAETPAGFKGTVTDESGARIPGATVVIRHKGNLRESIPDRNLVTDESGEFAIELLPGFYDVLLMAHGFEPIVEKLEIKTGEHIVFTRKMQVYPEEIVDDLPEAMLQTTTSEVPDQIFITPPKRKK
jgi:hypothetical protein